MADLLLSVAMLAALALILGGTVLWRMRSESRKGIAMIVAGVVVLANVAIWSLPAPQGTGQHR